MVILGFTPNISEKLNNTLISSPKLMTVTSSPLLKWSTFNIPNLLYLGAFPSNLTWPYFSVLATFSSVTIVSVPAASFTPLIVNGITSLWVKLISALIVTWTSHL